MLKPEHFAAQQLQHQQNTQRRAISVAIVAVIHVGVIYALASGLAANMTAHLIQDVEVAVVKEKPPDVKPPPPPPPDFKVPPPDFVPPPEISIQSDAPTNAISQVQKQVATVAPPPPVTQITAPRSEGTHDCQSQYPPLSRRLSEQGIVTLKFTVMVDGTIAGPKVVKSSGFQRLDDAAVQCVSRWRYHPATQGGKPLAVSLEANVRYQLR
ncbi:MAG TPA: energy transducer TonB [Rhizomicrobium sp.]|nr:energy transducer TonB [Rhizomicrobium sp.]